MYEARLGLSGRPNRVYSYSLISLRLSSLNAEQKGYFLMLLLPTETTIEAVNVCTDRRHPFHTDHDHNRFRRFGFTQQNIVVNIDNVERDMEILNGKGSLRH